VICHASAWDLDNVDDIRIKMCIKVNADDFVTVHHELGHNYYQRAYKEQPFLYLDGANDGFHEAIGDMIALSITPEYLVQIGLLDRAQVPSADKDIGLLLRQAMDKVAFLPFGLLVDRWRWGVFDGSIRPPSTTSLDRCGCDTRASSAGRAPRTTSIRAPSTTSRATRPTPAISSRGSCSSSSTRRRATRPAGPGRCTAARSTATRKSAGTAQCDAGNGRAKPWPDALEAFTGEREMSGKAMAEYFAPLKAWLDEQNRGKPCSLP
jgi:peptidyl-dipeptidase A